MGVLAWKVEMVNVKLRTEPPLCSEDDEPKISIVAAVAPNLTCSGMNYALSQSSNEVQTHSDQEDDRKAAEVTFYPCITIQHDGEWIDSKNRPM